MGSARDVVLLASGATQHVFISHDAADSDWVYKTPAFIDELLPGRLGFRHLQPQRRRSRLLYAMAFQVPRSLWNSPVAWFLRVRDPYGMGTFVREGYLAILTRLLGSLHRRARIRRFAQTAALLARTAGTPAADCLMPWRVGYRASLRLHYGGRVKRYHGPVLAQRRADLFYDGCDGLAHFDWGEVVRAQHTLWRTGVGIGDAATAIGPLGWALLDGRLRLADTGSLTADRERAAYVLQPHVIRQTIERRLQRVPPDLRMQARAYFDAVRPGLDPTLLRETWSTATR